MLRYPATPYFLPKLLNQDQILIYICLIQKLRYRQLAAPLESETIQDLVLNELKAKKHTATEGLVWLVRGLDFTAVAISQNLATPSEELSTSFRNSYGNTLKPYHSWG